MYVIIVSHSSPNKSTASTRTTINWYSEYFKVIYFLQFFWAWNLQNEESKLGLRFFIFSNVMKFCVTPQSRTPWIYLLWFRYHTFLMIYVKRQFLFREYKLSDISLLICRLTLSRFVTKSDDVKRRTYKFALFGEGGSTILCRLTFS